MRYTFIFTITLFLHDLLIAQSGEWRVLGGVQMSSQWQKQPYYISGGDVSFHVETTEPVPFRTYSLIYSRPINHKWAWSAGINVNRKGVKEKGILYDYTIKPPTRVYELDNFDDYIGSLIGARYLFFDKNNWQFNAEVLLNPEIEVQGYRNRKKFVVSSMAVLNIEKALNPHFSVVLSPFFETALMRYTKLGSNPYTPLAYGLMLGLKYRKN